MKRSILFLFLFSLFFVSCQEEVYIEGPPGPPGLRGPEGPAGEPGEEAFTFDYEDIDFLAPDYQVFIPFPEDFFMYATDVVLVYLLWGTEEVEGELLDIWRPLPQTWFTEFGTLQYNFDFSYLDVSLFLDSNFDLGFLGPNYTDDWIVRIVVVPAQDANGRVNVDYNNYYEVAKHYDIKDAPVYVNQKTNRRVK
ncbi:MAG: hypothetical protein ACNS62_25370 [Candidatus Cyclobacteriaceae bacterium M3_2C_046]